MADACECGNEPSGSVNCGQFLANQLASQERLHHGVSKYG